MTSKPNNRFYDDDATYFPDTVAHYVPEAPVEPVPPVAVTEPSPPPAPRVISTDIKFHHDERGNIVGATKTERTGDDG